MPVQLRHFLVVRRRQWSRGVQRYAFPRMASSMRHPSYLLQTMKARLRCTCASPGLELVGALGPRRAPRDQRRSVLDEDGRPGQRVAQHRVGAGKRRVERDGTLEQLDGQVPSRAVRAGTLPALAEIELPLGERVVRLGVRRAALMHPGLAVRMTGAGATAKTRRSDTWSWTAKMSAGTDVEAIRPERGAVGLGAAGSHSPAGGRPRAASCPRGRRRRAVLSAAANGSVSVAA